MEGEVDPKPVAGPRGDFNYEGLQQAPEPWAQPSDGMPTKDTLISLNSVP